MAAVSVSVSDSNTDLLSDDQIEQLLQEAEARLLAKASHAQASLSAETSDVIALQEETETDQARRKAKAIPRLQHGLNKSSPYISEKNGVAKVNPALLTTTTTITTTSKQANTDTDTLRPVQVKQKAKKEEPTDAGPDFFHMPKTVVSDSLKRDFALLQLRSVLDPHRHYKKTNSKKGVAKIPQFSQTGTVIEGPTEFFSSRINRKDRSKNFVEEALSADRQVGGRFKRKYNEIQVAKTSGKKAHYKSLMKKRRRG